MEIIKQDYKKPIIFAYHKNKKEIESGWEKFFECLSVDERMQVNRYKKETDRETMLVSRYILRKILEIIIKIDGSKIELSKTEYDRPFSRIIKEKSGPDFNVSHSGEWIVWAINPKGSVGIDIEEIRPIDLNVMKNVFTKKEIEYVKDKEGGREERFYQLWTLKEAFVKAIGEGLSYPLKNFYFDIKNDNRVEFRSKIKFSGYRFRQYNYIKGYKLSLCIEKSVAPKAISIIKELN